MSLPNRDKYGKSGIKSLKKGVEQIEGGIRGNETPYYRTSFHISAGRVASSESVGYISLECVSSAPNDRLDWCRARSSHSRDERIREAGPLQSHVSTFQLLDNGIELPQVEVALPGGL